ncbi:hypothetical protein [Sphingomonas sp.]|uniref:hypothetical protein n=1 Tax=Sphingomonas sp. TaxID=28214 RepID=UPI0035BC1684
MAAAHVARALGFAAIGVAPVAAVAIGNFWLHYALPLFLTAAVLSGEAFAIPRTGRSPLASPRENGQPTPRDADRLAAQRSWCPVMVRQIARLPVYLRLPDMRVQA